MKPGPVLALLALALPLALCAPKPTRATDAPPNLVGLWRLDPTRSDLAHRLRATGGRPEGGGGSEAKGPRPEWKSGDGRPKGGPGDGPGGHRPGRLPELLRITAKEGRLMLADSTGAVVQEIALNGHAAAAPASGSTTLELAGVWKDGHLEVERPGWRGNTALDRWSLGEGGEILVLETKMTGNDALPGLQTKRVYLKVKAG